MKELKIKKGPILLPLALLAVGLTAYTLLNFRGASAADSLSVGQQYLNDLNYGGAVAAFTQAIELDPGNREARIGLARAYAGNEEYTFAQQVLEEMVYSQQPDEDATRAMVELLRQAGQTQQAVRLVQMLIDTTDGETYYALRQELLGEIYASPRSLAMGTDQSLLIRDGKVLSKGYNVLGQLGTAPSDQITENYAPAHFNGTAAKVACVGRTSFVVDESGGLWAAGEDRWGQMGEGFAVTSPRGGWQQIPCPAPVADVAGTTGRLLVLLTDGTVWSVGASGSQTLQRLYQFPVVLEIASVQQRAALLTSAGRLYCSSSDSPERWELAASGVSSFSMSEDTLCWVGTNQAIASEWGSLTVPDSWYTESGIKADIAVDKIVSVNELTLLTAAGGQLYRLPGDGTVAEVACASPVIALYPQGDALVLEYADGSAQYWRADMAGPKPLSQI